jgi:hypothetical protein
MLRKFTNNATLVFYLKLLQEMLFAIVGTPSFCILHSRKGATYSSLVLCGFKQHPLHLILDIKAHLEPVLQAKLLDDVLPVEFADGPASTHLG